MPISASGTALIRLGVVTLMAAGLAGVWELLALQAPGTPLYLGMLPAPITALRELATTLGLLLIAAGLTHAWTRGPGEVALIAALYLGMLVALGAQLYGAAQGMTGVQMSDLRPDALPLFLVKHAGLLLVGLALLEHGRRLLFRPPPDSGGSSLRDQAIARGRLEPRRTTTHTSARQLDPKGHDH